MRDQILAGSGERGAGRVRNKVATLDSLIAGVLYDKINSSVPFYFGAATAAISAVLMVIFVRTGRKKSNYIIPETV
jgi:hypothetical protein